MPGYAADLLPVPVEVIERRIYLIRAQKVMLDSGLAGLYQVDTFNLNKADLQAQGRFSFPMLGRKSRAAAASPR